MNKSELKSLAENLTANSSSIFAGIHNKNALFEEMERIEPTTSEKEWMNLRLKTIGY